MIVTRVKTFQHIDKNLSQYEKSDALAAIEQDINDFIDDSENIIIKSIDIKPFLYADAKERWAYRAPGFIGVIVYTELIKKTD